MQFDLGREIFIDAGTLTAAGRGSRAAGARRRYNRNVEFWETDDFTLADVLGARPIA